MTRIDPFLTCDSHSEEDLRNLAYFGTTGVVLSTGAPRRYDRFEEILEAHRRLCEVHAQRVRDAGMTVDLAIGLSVRAAPRRAVPEIWPHLERLAKRDDVVAIGIATVET